MDNARASYSHLFHIIHGNKSRGSRRAASSPAVYSFERSGDGFHAYSYPSSRPKILRRIIIDARNEVSNHVYETVYSPLGLLIRSLRNRILLVRVLSARTPGVGGETPSVI